MSAYADDVNVVLSNDKDAELLKNALSEFGEISGLHINKQKSRVLPLGQRHVPPQVRDLQTVNNFKILGITFTASTEEMRHINWQNIVRKIKVIAQTLFFFS